MRYFWNAALVASLFATNAYAEDAAPVAPKVGVVDAPCSEIEPPPQLVVDYFKQAAAAQAAGQKPPIPSKEDLAINSAWQKRVMLADFSGLCKYQDANAVLPAASDHRVIFFGDSITELWGLRVPDLFTNDVVNRGISGQTTLQMIGRFRADVIVLHPKLVHIIAGTNDIAGNTGPTSLERIESNIETMVDLAQLHGVKVIIGATPPAAKFSWRPEIDSVATITAYNVWLKAFAERKGVTFIDYNAALNDGTGGIPAALSEDGVHPNAAGYAVMNPLVRKVIADSLKD